MSDHTCLAAALAAFQAEMPTVHKGKTAKVPTKAGRCRCGHVATSREKCVASPME